MTEGGSFNPCVVIPIYDNEHTIRGVVESLPDPGMACVIVDDGSNEATQRVFDCVETTEGLHPLIASGDCQRQQGCSVPLVLVYSFPDQELEITTAPDVTTAIEALVEAADVAGRSKSS